MATVTRELKAVGLARIYQGLFWARSLFSSLCSCSSPMLFLRCTLLIN